MTALTMNTHKRAKIAHHEASHAVAARTQGLACPHITMFSTDGFGLAGATTESATHRARDADLATLLAALHKDIIVSFAGPSGEFHYKPSAKRYSEAWDDDFDHARSFAVQAALIVDGIDPRSLLQNPDGSFTIDLNVAQQARANDSLEQGRDAATDLVKQHWSAIERVAQALMTRDVLYQDELDRLIGGQQQIAALKS